MKNHIHNVLIVIENKGKCESNCPWCKFASINFLEKNWNKVSKQSILEKIDYLEKNKEFIENSHLLFHPWEYLFDYERDEFLKIINYAANKLWKPIQIEIPGGRNYNKIIDFLDNDDVKKLIWGKKIYLNLYYKAFWKEKIKTILKNSFLLLIRDF